jgi:hypothetical protein
MNAIKCDMMRGKKLMQISGEQVGNITNTKKKRQRHLEPAFLKYLVII